MKIDVRKLRKYNLSQKAMDVKTLTRISLMGAMQFVAFVSFSDVLYLEVITLVTILFAMNFKRKEAILASVVFAFVNMALKQGVTTWSIMYLVIFPMYSLLTSVFKPFLAKKLWRIICWCGILSFMIGQLMQIPFLLVSSKVTLIYLTLGLKASAIQAGLSIVACTSVYPILDRVLKRINRENNRNEKNLKTNRGI